jgi:hypothetical protein
MFERAPKPGGTWFYNEEKPLPAPFSYVHFSTISLNANDLIFMDMRDRNRPLNTSAYIPDIPKKLPRIYSDGDEGLSNDWRLQEHWIRSPIWANMTTVSPSVCKAHTHSDYNAEYLSIFI